MSSYLLLEQVLAVPERAQLGLLLLVLQLVLRGPEVEDEVLQGQSHGVHGQGGGPGGLGLPTQGVQTPGHTQTHIYIYLHTHVFI